MNNDIRPISQTRTVC